MTSQDISPISTVETMRMSFGLIDSRNKKIAVLGIISIPHNVQSKYAGLTVWSDLEHISNTFILPWDQHPINKKYKNSTQSN